MSEVETALLGALRGLQHPGDFDRTAVVRQTDAELYGLGVYHQRRWPAEVHYDGGSEADRKRIPAVRQRTLSIAPRPGERDGQYRHGERTKATNR
jgi:hypothetical protein